ncbi:uncharacterized protein L3040_005879 [Drepanopeziza brunnea f. sp. 'multigermtubi']|uniref:uncharacterized protein n=1 Tax=Drepanopeziza brunnea f. sp. 'multigermtubi' TaxID=698441 RepID=UPI00238B3A98|nr:hypothetical protein L3040_005879 [Drepanopeziza brunnea f. sp. 'multigermtubi']
MLRGPSSIRVLKPLLTIAGTAGIIVTSLATLRFGMLTLTIDILVKLLVTFAYTHGLSSVRGRLQKAKVEEFHSQAEATSNPEQDVFAEKVDNFDTRSSSSATEYADGPRMTATVVGWREDEELYRTCLRGFAFDPQCGPVIAGIDGDTEADEDMLKTFLSVFPDGHVVRLKEPLSQTLDRYMLSANLGDFEDEQNCKFVMDHVSSAIRSAIAEQLFPQGIKNIQALCVIQPHRSKKDILFTALSFASIISEELGFDYLFSTDSDSAIMPGAMSEMTRMFESDTNVGGVSGHLRFSHPQPTFLSRMTASHYWFEQEISKAQGSIFGATECQPGPCAAFRVSALKSVLVTNEDRHLTTRILWAGYTVHYAHKAIVYTDAPNNFTAWVKQQVRWSRVTMIETLWYPWMVNRLYPWHIYNILKARSMPLLVFMSITSCALGLETPTPITVAVLADVFCMYALQVVYLVHVSADFATRSDIIWLVPSIAWFFLMMPAIVVWSLVTIQDDSWGNIPRGSLGTKGGKEMIQPRAMTGIKHIGFMIVWIGVILVAVGRVVFSLWRA